MEMETMEPPKEDQPQEADMEMGMETTAPTEEGMMEEAKMEGEAPMEEGMMGAEGTDDYKAMEGEEQADS